MDNHPVLDDKLYQGGSVEHLQDTFKVYKPTVIIDCSTNGNHLGVPKAGIYIKAPFTDEPLTLSEHGNHIVSRLSIVAECAARFIRDGERVFTYCGDSENQSGLLNGLILLEMRHMGLITFKNVVEFIRNRRPQALSNHSYVYYLNQKCQAY